MASPTPDPHSQPSLAEALFLECLATGGDFEALRAAHPDLAGALDAVRADFQRGMAFLHPDPPAPEPPYVASQLGQAERYDGAVPIGAGGMGQVSEVLDRKLGRRVALKALRPAQLSERLDQASKTRRRARLVAEARVLARLEHPSILPIYDLNFDERGEPSFTMLRVRGIELEHAFDAARSGADGWTDARILEVLFRVCEALAYAHSRGVVHRDLKPANVMVGEFGEVFVMDWGLAKVVDAALHTGGTPSSQAERARDAEADEMDLALTLEGEVLGTLAYMAPEQARSAAEIGPAVDIYAFGAVLYRWLSGHAPYHDRGRRISTHELLAQVVSSPPSPLRQVARGKPAELVAIAEKAMQRDPRRRYASMGEVLVDLRAFAEDRPGSAWRDGVARRATKWVRRRPALAVTLLALAVLGAGAAAFSARLNVVAAQAELSRRGERERNLERDFERLREHESSERQDRRMRMLANERAALACADAVARAGIELEAARDDGDAIELELASFSPDERRSLRSIAYLMVRYLEMAGMGMAHAATQGAALPGDPASWSKMAAEHPRAVALWPRALRLARLAQPDGLGARAVELVAARQSGAVDLSDLLAGSWRDATAEEREFAAFVVVGAQGTEAARPLIEELLRDHPDSAWGHLQLSTALAHAGQPERARSHALAALAASPDSALAHNNMGALLGRSGDREAALDHYQRACDLMPDSSDHLLNTAAALNVLERPFEALDYFEGVDPQMRESADAKWIRGVALLSVSLETGDEALLLAARDDLRRATELGPERRDAWRELGFACEALERDDEAEATYRAGLAALPGSGDLKLSLSQLLWRKGQRCEAIALLLEVRRDYPAASAPANLLEEFRESLEDERELTEFDQWVSADV